MVKKSMTVEPRKIGFSTKSEGSSRLLRFATSFPIRYYVCAFILAYLFSVNISFFTQIEERILESMFQFLNISFAHIEGNLYVGSANYSTVVNIPIHAQFIFLIFFPAIAIAGRINVTKRAQFIGFGILCFF